MNAQASPWERPDLVRWAVTLTVGMAISGVAWWLASDRVEFSDQVPYASVGIAGLLVGSSAHLSWLLRGRRAVGQRRLFLLSDPVARRASAVASTGDPVLLAVDGRARYHRPGCPLLDGRAMAPAARTVHEAAGRKPCGVCRP